MYDDITDGTSNSHIGSYKAAIAQIMVRFLERVTHAEKVCLFSLRVTI